MILIKSGQEQGVEEYPISIRVESESYDLFPDVAIPNTLLTPYVLDSIRQYEGAAVCLEDGVTGEVVTYDQVS